MKSVIALFMSMLLSAAAFADATEVPPYLKDAVITVTLKNGKVYTYSANTHAVVLRASSNKKKPAEVVIVEKTTVVEKASKQMCEESGFREQKKNRIRLMGGRGPDGVQADTGATSTRIKMSQGLVGGVGYDRSLNEEVNAGVQIMSNGTATLGLGLDF